MAAAASLEPQPEKVGLEPGDNDKECSICHELFTHPKLLPCAHVMCRHCILAMPTASTNQEPVCPCCLSAIADTKQGKQPAGGWEKVVEKLPDDVAMAALVECTRLLRGDHVCGGCRQSSAVSVCLHCCDMLCDTCTTSHANLSATRSHTVERLTTMTAEKLCVSQPASCSEHADMASELYCPKHGAAICHLCASSVHRACPEVILFDKRVQDLKAELAGMSEVLKTAEQNLTRAIDDLDNKLLEAEQKTNKVVTEVEEACNRLENAVKACRKRLKELALKFKQNVEVSVHDAQTGLKQRRGHVTSHRRVVDRVKMTSPPGQMEKVTDLMRARVKDFEVEVSESSAAVKMFVLRLDPASVTHMVTEILSFWDYTSEKLSGNPVQDEVVSETEGSTTDAKKVPLPVKSEVLAKTEGNATEAKKFPLPTKVEVLVKTECKDAGTEAKRLPLPSKPEIAKTEGNATEAKNVPLSTKAEVDGKTEGNAKNVPLSTKAEVVGKTEGNATDANNLPLSVKAGVVEKVDFKVESTKPLPRWKFAPNDKALFSNKGWTAERKSGSSVILVSGTPMEVGVLYEVRIDVILGNTKDFLSCGVVKKPLSDHVLPETTLNGWEQGIVFCDTVYKYNEKKSNIKISTRLQELKEGDSVGFLRDQRGLIFLFICGKKQLVYVEDSESTYIFFELHHCFRKITCLPPTDLKYL